MSSMYVGARTERTLRVLGDRSALVVAAELLEQDATTTALSGRSRLAPRELARALELLHAAGLIGRHPGAQGAWFALARPETIGLLEAARRLGVAIAGVEDRDAELEHDALTALAGTDKAAAAARRGRRRADGT